MNIFHQSSCNLKTVTVLNHIFASSEQIKENLFMQIEGIFPPMGFSLDGIETDDNGGSRSGRDRRKLTIIEHKPERRTGQERRNGMDRRKDQRYRGELAIERRDKFRG